MKLAQNGRSMVEMLGVLAIIGVLSVGGLAGYSYAMKKYKLIKQRDQIIRIMSGVTALAGGKLRENFPDPVNNITDLLLDAGVISDDEYVNSTTIIRAYDGKESTIYLCSDDHGECYQIEGAWNIAMGFKNIDNDLCIDLISNPPWQGYTWSFGMCGFGELKPNNMSTALEKCKGNYNEFSVKFLLE